MEREHFHVVAFRQLVIAKAWLQQFSHSRLISELMRRSAVSMLAAAGGEQEPRILRGVSPQRPA